MAGATGSNDDYGPEEMTFATTSELLVPIREEDVVVVICGILFSPMVGFGDR